MENPRAEKVAAVDEVRSRLSSADAAFLTEYRGLKVKDLAVLRRSLRASGGDYKIYKNTLVRFAASDLGLSELDGLLVGPTAVTFVSGDAAGVAKALRDFTRTHPLLVIKGGVLGDKILGPAETAALADLPSREVLLARLAGGLAAPLQQLAGLLQALPRNLAHGLKALLDKRVEAGEAAPAASEAPAASAVAPDTPSAVDEAPAASAVDEAPAASVADEAPAAFVADEAPAASVADEAPAGITDAGEPPAASAVAPDTPSAVDEAPAAAPREPALDESAPGQSAPPIEEDQP